MYYIVYTHVKRCWTMCFCMWIQNAQSGFSDVSLKLWTVFWWLWLSNLRFQQSYESFGRSDYQSVSVNMISSSTEMSTQAVKVEEIPAKRWGRPTHPQNTFHGATLCVLLLSSLSSESTSCWWEISEMLWQFCCCSGTVIAFSLEDFI